MFFECPANAIRAALTGRIAVHYSIRLGAFAPEIFQKIFDLNAAG